MTSSRPEDAQTAVLTEKLPALFKEWLLKVDREVPLCVCVVHTVYE